MTNESFLKKIRNLFFTGLAVIFPVAATLWILITLFKIIDNILGSIIYPIIGQKIWGLGFLSTFLAIIWLGILTRNIVGRTLLNNIEHLIRKLPIVKNIYNPAKQLVEIFTKSPKSSFRKVVLVEYPRPQMWALGFLTNDKQSKGIVTGGKEIAQDLLCVFLPTSPNPTSGYFVMLPAEDIKILDMTIEEGIRMIISGGVITPEKKE